MPLSEALSSASRFLAARLEAAEAANVASMARSLALEMPETAAATEEIAGGTAVFAGVGSPMTHAIGVGMRGPVAAAEFDRLEEFFRQRGSASSIDLCPLGDASVLGFIQSRNYRIAEWNNVMARVIGADERFAPAPDWVLHMAAPEQRLLWSRVVVAGFEERADVNEDFVALMSATCSRSVCLLGGRGGEPCGGAAMGIENGVAHFYGDATLAHARGGGLQSALIRARLALARDRGCDLAMASVIPGSVSNRNYERAGFRLVYMRVNVIREW
jgi:GNAT superfamily N-acetyltransferase